MTTSLQPELSAPASRLAVPRPLTAALAVTGAFGVVVLALGAIFGLPLTPPTERVSLATGFHSGLPVAIGTAAYLLARLLHRVLRGSRWDRREIGRVIALDLGLMALFIAACYLHFHLKMWAPLINPARFDDFYMHTDEMARGVIDAMIWLRTSVSVGNVQVDHFYQGAFLASFIISFVYFAVLDRRYYYQYIVATIAMLCFGAGSYLVAPAVGPFIFEAGVNSRASEAQAGMWGAYQSLRAEGIPWLQAHGSAYFTGALAAMPSLHVGHALIATTYMVRSRSMLWPLFVALFCWMSIEAVATRWHYLIDLPAGLLLAFGVMSLTSRIVPLEAAAGEPLPAVAR